MGKRNNLKNKFRKNKKGTFGHDDIENLEEAKKFMNEMNESFVILQKLNSNNYSDRENITALLASHEFSSNEEKMKTQLVQPEMCKSLCLKLADPFIQVRYNAISAIINLMICYSECEIDCIFLFDANLMTHIEELFSEHMKNVEINVQFTEGEMGKINKTIKATVDLLLLITELYDCDENKNYNKLDFSMIIKYIIHFLLNPKSLGEEVILNSCLFLANIFSLKVFNIEENSIINNNFNNSIKDFVEFANKIVSDHNGFNKANVLVRASFISCLFYISCNNYKSINTDSNSISNINTNQINLDYIKNLIELTYSNINFSIGNQIEELNLIIQNYTKKVTISEGMQVEGEIENHDEDKTLKDKMKTIENSLRATIICMKTLTDIINSFEIRNNFDIDNIDEYSMEEYNKLKDEEDIEDDQIKSNSGDSLTPDIEKNIQNVVNAIFQKNTDSLFNMLRESLLPNTIKLFDNLTIEEFLLNDFDKMIVIKELLYDLEFYTLSLINNVIQNFDGIFNQHLNILSSVAFSILSRLQIEEYSKNQDFLSVLLTCFRSTLEKYKNINELQSNFKNLDFRTLFVIYNNNLNDRFIKINIIDIIGFVFSYTGHSDENNLEICKLLYNLCLKEDDMEVASHVLNAYFDIYKEDDLNTNIILKHVGVIDLMKMGVNEFKSRIKNAYQIREIDNVAYEYAKETLLNLKRFIKYKEKIFKEQKLI